MNAEDDRSNQTKDETLILSFNTLKTSVNSRRDNGHSGKLTASQNCTKSDMENSFGHRHVETLLRALRSTGPREVLLRLVTNRDELQKQLSAVMLQSAYRGYCGRKRAKKIRKHLNMFMTITEDLAATIMEEFTLASGLEIAVNFYRVNNRYNLLVQSLEEAMLLETISIIDMVSAEMVQEVVGELVSAFSDALLALRKQQLLQRQLAELPRQRDYLLESNNPLIKAMLELFQEECRTVAIEAIHEEVAAYFTVAYAHRITPHVIDEVLHIEVLRILLDELAVAEEESKLRDALGMIEKAEVSLLLQNKRHRNVLVEAQQQLQLKGYSETASNPELMGQTQRCAMDVVWKSVADAMLRRILATEKARYEGDYSGFSI